MKTHEFRIGSVFSGVGKLRIEYINHKYGYIGALESNLLSHRMNYNHFTFANQIPLTLMVSCSAKFDASLAHLGSSN